MMEYPRHIKIGVRCALVTAMAVCVYLPYHFFGVLPLFTLQNEFAAQEDQRLAETASTSPTGTITDEYALVGPDKIFVDVAELEQAKKDWMWCGFCHYTAANAPHRIGPNLNGIIGRRIGSKNKYFYTGSFRQASAEGRVWTENLLDRFLATPQEQFPGNRMRYAPITDQAKRTRIIKYLRAFAR